TVFGTRIYPEGGSGEASQRSWRSQAAAGRLSAAWFPSDQIVSINVGRDLDQAAVGIAAVHGHQRAARAGALVWSGFDRNTASLEMRHHGIRAGAGQEAQVLAARRLMVRREPLDLAGRNRPHVDLHRTEPQHGDWPIRPRFERLSRHAEHALVPASRSFDVAHVEHEVIERIDFDHRGSLREKAAGFSSL